jgi:hypothetical protein
MNNFLNFFFFLIALISECNFKHIHLASNQELQPILELTRECSLFLFFLLILDELSYEFVSGKLQHKSINSACCQ